ncbi:MAG TPA: DUF2330 domain-containing protein [Actinomycetota bacterium]|jgi:hypothetical protein
MKRIAAGLFLSTLLVVAIAGPALACGGLVAPNGSVNLLRTSTLAAYHDGVEHYVTSFEFVGGGAEFGSIVPLPGIPSKVTRGGEWTLQRLQQETSPPVLRAVSTSADSAALAGPAQVILQTEIDGLDITILEGGATAVGTWANDNGFNLSPDTPEVLEFYARRSPIFMAVSFDPKDDDVDDLRIGDGVPIHLRIPTTNPWVPLRILGLGKAGGERIEADVYLLTDDKPALLPKPVDPATVNVSTTEGLVLGRSERASDLLMSDLRSDKGMRWMPESGMWLTFLRLDSKARDLTYDLAVDATGAGRPSSVAAGLTPPNHFTPPEPLSSPGLADAMVLVWAVVLPLALVLAVTMTNRVIDGARDERGRRLRF